MALHICKTLLILILITQVYALPVPYCYEYCFNNNCHNISCYRDNCYNETNCINFNEANNVCFIDQFNFIDLKNQLFEHYVDYNHIIIIIAILNNTYYFITSSNPKCQKCNFNQRTKRNKIHSTFHCFV